MKIYYHRVPGARFIMPGGAIVEFMGGQLSTEDSAVQAELDKVANIPASMIYTQESMSVSLEEKEMQKELLESATAAFDNTASLQDALATARAAVAARS